MKRLWEITAEDNGVSITVLAFSCSHDRIPKQKAWILDCMTDEFENFIDMSNPSEETKKNIEAFNSNLRTDWNSDDFSDLPGWDYYMFHNG